jgi:PAS domain S-box-containing protein
VDHQEFLTRTRNLLKLRKQQIQLASRADTLARELKDSERSREAALRDSSERLAQVIDTVPAMICATDKQGCILFINACQAALGGVGANEAIGLDMPDERRHQPSIELAPERYRCAEGIIGHAPTGLAAIVNWRHGAIAINCGTALRWNQRQQRQAACLDGWRQAAPDCESRTGS